MVDWTVAGGVSSTSGEVGWSDVVLLGYGAFCSYYGTRVTSYGAYE